MRSTPSPHLERGMDMSNITENMSETDISEERMSDQESYKEIQSRSRENHASAFLQSQTGSFHSQLPMPTPLFL
ncbi:hypothetical protein Tco_0315794 [Tanacetum coccineum]